MTDATALAAGFAFTLAVGVLLGYALGHMPCRMPCCKALKGRH